MIALTDVATEKVRELIEAEGEIDLALRVAVRPGGCSGYSYEMFFDSETEADDMSQFFGDGDVRVVSDPMSAQLLEGATLDFKDGLMGSGFAIDNPNAQRTCGCGSSFSVEPSFEISESNSLSSTLSQIWSSRLRATPCSSSRNIKGS